MGVNIMDDFFSSSGAGHGQGFAAYQSFNSSFGNGNGAVKRTSTSTTFVNGKKIMTKR